MAQYSIITGETYSSFIMIIIQIGAASNSYVLNFHYGCQKKNSIVTDIMVMQITILLVLYK